MTGQAQHGPAVEDERGIGLSAHDWRRHPSGRIHRWPSLRHRRRRMFLRLWVTFGFVTLLLVAGLAGLTFVIQELLRPGGATSLLPWAVAILAAALSPLVAAIVARRAFRGIAAPLSDLIAAADRMAEGDLSARVAQVGRGDVARLARSFNHMAEELQRAEEVRRNLTADVAHELRTPLQIIQGNLEGILDDVYEPSDENLLSTLEETRSLGRLVDDLRTLSLAEAGQLRLSMEPLLARELLADVATSFSGQAEVVGVKLTVQVSEEDAGLTFQGDAGRMDEILTNLVANALRYTPRGGSITLGARAIPSGVRLTVADTGEGIPEDDLPHIFDRYWRDDGARGTQGAGLGLAIARQLVQAQGGEIQVHSAVGQGTTFHIDLPRGPIEGIS